MKRQMLKYAVVGLLGTVLHFALLYLLVEAAHIHPVAASGLGFIVVLIVSYWLNKRWTFDQAVGGWGAFLKYSVVSMTGLLLNVSLMYIAVDWLKWHYLIGQCLVVAAVPAANFILNYFWTFRKLPSTRSRDMLN